MTKREFLRSLALTVAGIATVGASSETMPDELELDVTGANFVLTGRVGLDALYESAHFVPNPKAKSFESPVVSVLLAGHYLGVPVYYASAFSPTQMLLGYSERVDRERSGNRA